jgi:hypothetical protein
MIPAKKNELYIEIAEQKGRGYCQVYLTGKA